LLDFDVAIATRMRWVSRPLGPCTWPARFDAESKGWYSGWPQDIERAIKEAKAGRVEFRLDKTANIHVSIGKASLMPINCMRIMPR